MTHHRLVPFLRSGLDGQPSTEWSTSQKNSYEILIQMTYCHLGLLPLHSRHLHTRIINYQSMGIALLPILSCPRELGVEGRTVKKSHLRYEFHRGVLSSPQSLLFDGLPSVSHDLLKILLLPTHTHYFLQGCCNP